MTKPVTDFEPIYAALFALVTSVPGFNRTGRVFMHWADVAAADQPALFLEEETETAEMKGQAMPNVWRLNVAIWIYVHVDPKAEAPATTLNRLLAAVRSALLPDWGEQRLGGLVQWCRITGNIEKDTPVVGQQMVAVVPVQLLTA